MVLHFWEGKPPKSNLFEPPRPHVWATLSPFLLREGVRVRT